MEENDYLNDLFSLKDGTLKIAENEEETLFKIRI